MIYRDGADERRAKLERDAAALRMEKEALLAERARLARELKGHQEEARREARRRLPLAKIEIASPCPAKWEEMVGDDKNRFCLACEKSVHDLTAMNGTELQAFLADSANETACIRIWQRVDGTVMRTDCPVGVRRARLRAVLASGATLAAIAIGCFTALAVLHHAGPALSDAPLHHEPVAAAVQRVVANDTARLSIFAPADAVVTVDGVSLGKGGAFGMYVTAGVPHIVTAVSSRGNQAVQQTALAAGQHGTVRLEIYEREQRIAGGRRPPEEGALPPKGSNL